MNLSFGLMSSSLSSFFIDSFIESFLDSITSRGDAVIFITDPFPTIYIPYVLHDIIDQPLETLIEDLSLSTLQFTLRTKSASMGRMASGWIYSPKISMSYPC
ncbi:hypothetical protein ALC60_00503 [Trachymyrmex zeteki]|uniref:Uncharacterized protein n=1 Tax=Mycetomoellerius zeteki TaxID=64791 RepID=A0A151XJZ1_9HYME|nr:hypothetical protein ALC60_00503 [Trachymyrmex zeteki]